MAQLLCFRTVKGYPIVVEVDKGSVAGEDVSCILHDLNLFMVYK